VRQERRLGDRFRVVAYKNCSFAAQPEERGVNSTDVGYCGILYIVQRSRGDVR